MLLRAGGAIRGAGSPQKGHRAFGNYFRYLRLSLVAALQFSLRRALHYQITKKIASSLVKPAFR